MSNSAFKVENGIIAVGAPGVNSQFYHDINVYQANLTVNGGVILVNGNFIVSGNLVYANTSIANTGLFPTFDQTPLGNTTNRFNVYSYNTYVFSTLNLIGPGNIAGNANISGTVTVAGNVGANAVTANVFVAPHTAIYSNVGQTNSVTQTIIDSFPKTLGNCFKFIHYVSDAAQANIHAIETLAITDGTNLLITKYADIFNMELGVFDASINNANVEVYFTAIDSNTYTVRTSRTILY